MFLNLSLCTNVARRKKWRRVNHWLTFLPHFDTFCYLFFFYNIRNERKKKNTFQVYAWLFANVFEISAFFTSKNHFLVRLLFFFLLFKNYSWILASPLLTNSNIWQNNYFSISRFVGKKDFLMAADVMNVKVIEVKDQVTLLERVIPKIYNSRVSAKIRVCVCHK